MLASRRARRGRRSWICVTFSKTARSTSIAASCVAVRSLCRVEPQVFDLLVHLIRHRDRVVSKDDLLETIWQGRVVSESALFNRINAARQAIGDTGDRQRLIKTLPRKGLRFVGEVREEDASRPPFAARSASA